MYIQKKNYTSKDNINYGIIKKLLRGLSPQALNPPLPTALLKKPLLFGPNNIL